MQSFSEENVFSGILYTVVSECGPIELNITMCDSIKETVGKMIWGVKREIKYKMSGFISSPPSLSN